MSLQLPGRVPDRSCCCVMRLKSLCDLISAVCQWLWTYVGGRAEQEETVVHKSQGEDGTFDKETRISQVASHSLTHTLSSTVYMCDTRYFY